MQMPQHDDVSATKTPAAYWEARYSGTDQVWSGRVNAVLAEVASQLRPGTALDLGCGEGGDVVWLARQGWSATGIDISATAVHRARRYARAEGLENATFLQHDLSTLSLNEQFDLVTASFLHAPVELARQDILQRAATLVRPGGHLLITSHAAPPPWIDSQRTNGGHSGEHERSFPTPDEELAALNLPAHEWRVCIAETRDREATDPEGKSVTLTDGVVFVQRRA